MDWIQQWQSKLNKQNGVAPLVRTGGSRHTGLAALPYRNIQAAWFPAFLGELLCPGHQMVQFCRIYISFFITILRQLREDMPEVVWAQIIQLCCF